jgi:hypothetical protein
MMKKAMAGTRHLVIAACAAALSAGCAGFAQDTRDGTVDIAKIDRVSWNAPSEPKLFRVAFDAKAAQWVRLRAGVLEAPEGVDPYFSQLQVLEDEAGRELRSRGLCGGSAQFVSYLDGGTAQSGITAVFRCRQTIF